MRAPITVVTPTTGQRAGMLGQCVEAIANQTLKPEAHLIIFDPDRIGGAWALNQALPLVQTEWMALIADDDLAYPHHLETLYNASTGLDMVYPFCDVTGREGFSNPTWNPNKGWDDHSPTEIMQWNWIPATVLIRTAVVMALGGYSESDPLEDWNMHKKMVAAGYSIGCVPVVTWQYRFHGTNISLWGERIDI